MIPIKLTLQGLFSYQEKQTIDFRRLTDAHLFGIFGAVGSGKSSVLDAITFALYGETERMNARDNRNYNMMNLKSDELLIEFDFTTGNGSNTFRAVVRGKRNRKNFGDVKTFERTAYRSLDGTWVPVLIEEMQQAIGLSYENFKRTIIIPQGKFQEFLQLGNKDRTQMMKELFGLEKFELYYKTVSLESKNSQQMQMLEGQLKQLGELNIVQLEQAKSRINDLAAAIRLLNDQLSRKRSEETALNQLKGLFDKLNEQHLCCEQLRKKEGDVLKTELHLKEYEFCLIQFKNLFEQSDQMYKRIEKYQSAAEAEEGRLKEFTLRLSQLQNAFEAVKKDYEQRDLVKQQAGEFIKIARIIELDALSLTNASRIAKGEETCNISTDKIRNAKKLQDELSAELRVLKSALPDLSVLAKVQNWFTLQKSILSRNQEWTKEHELVVTEIKGLHDRLNQCVCDYVPAGQHFELPSLLEFLASSIHEIKTLIAGVDLNIEHLLTRSKLEEYATNLIEGTPCPLCGSLSHPDLLSSGDVKDALLKERDAKLQHTLAIEALEKVMTAVRQIETQLNLKMETVKSLENKLAANRVKLEEHHALFIWPEYTSEDMVTHKVNQAESMLLLIRTKESELEKIRTGADQEQKLLDHYITNLEKIREQQTILLTEMNMLIGQIEVLDVAVYRAEPMSRIKQLADSLLLKYSDIESLYQKTAAELTNVEKRQSESQGRLQANSLVLNQEQNNLVILKEQIAQCISAANYSSVDQIRAILDQKIDAGAVKQSIREFREKLLTAENQLQLIQAEIGERSYLAEYHLKLKGEISQLTEELDAKNREYGNTEGFIRKMMQDLEQQQQISKLLKRCELRAENIKTMKQLFKGSGFVNYVSSVHLRNLCTAANDRFYKLVRQKMSLDITDDNNFQVYDFLNGGKVRSVKTLSGGQTFQAALSLALALADSIQRFTASSQNFFFLDEGFGTLDKESLDVVFETLKSLRKENRIVGVISHVEEMQQEIDTHLRIINHDETGSQIFASWEG